ncbi:MAG: hypothetical protein NPIRA03_11130 [Nitrospirales bacterium]|nr:MAG: hypothetical protein NPIRA03_11130 [Nitrospirales bacterium]
MMNFLTIEQLEQEILYLQEQNLKLIKELSQVVKENHRLREEIYHEKHPSHGHRGGKEKEGRTVSRKVGQENREDDGLCLN